MFMRNKHVYCTFESHEQLDESQGHFFGRQKKKKHWQGALHARHTEKYKSPHAYLAVQQLTKVDVRSHFHGYITRCATLY